MHAFIGRKCRPGAIRYAKVVLFRKPQGLEFALGFFIDIIREQRSIRSYCVMPGAVGLP